MQNENTKYLEPEKMPPMSAWQLKFPIDAVVFDCDHTLSQIEGISSLAEKNGVGKEIKTLTDNYEKRLALTKPTRQQVIQLGAEYYQRRSPDVESVINTFKKLGKEIFIISSGLHPAVQILGVLLGVSEKNIFSVAVNFDEEGNYVDYDRQAPTTQKDGKLKIIEKLKTRYNHIVYVASALDDYEAKGGATRFIGYGGSLFRENLAQLCQFYIRTTSFLPVLPLSLTHDETERLSLPEQEKYQEGLIYITNGEVQIRME